jgi:hypothetical protein
LRHRSRRATPVALVVVVVALALVASGCSGGGVQKKAAADPTTRPKPTTTTALPGPPYPLTGLPVTDPGKAARPALWVKLDNAPKARPQTGLGKADVVFEEVVEGGLTRFMALFHSGDANPVGPVRSVRPVDPEIVTQLRGLFAYSGGAPKFVRMLHKAPVQDVGVDALAGAYYRDRSRPAPDNQYTRTDTLWGAARNQPAAGALFTYVPAGETFPANGVQAGVMHGVTFTLQRITVDWDWDAASARWMRRTDGVPHMTTDTGQLGFQNVLLQFVPYRLSNDVDVGGNRVPYGDVIGSGRVWYMANGRMFQGKWSKPSAAAPTQFTDDAGRPVPLVPGHTMVELVPTGITPVTR